MDWYGRWDSSIINDGRLKLIIINMYLPQISSGRITRKIILNNSLSAILLEDITSLTIGIEFDYLLFFYAHQDIEVLSWDSDGNEDSVEDFLNKIDLNETNGRIDGPLICFSSEGGTGPHPHFCAFTENGHVNYGSDKKFKDFKYFIKDSIQIFKDMLEHPLENEIIISKVNRNKEYIDSINDEIMISAIFKILTKDQIDLELSGWINNDKNDSNVDNKSSWWKFWK